MNKKTLAGNNNIVISHFSKACFPFNQQPPFLAQMLHRQRGECNKMRPIQPQSCMCTLRGSTVVDTSTEEWQLPRPRVLSVHQVIGPVGVTAARITFPDYGMKKRDGKEKRSSCIRLFIGRIPVIGWIACFLVDWLTGALLWERRIRREDAQSSITAKEDNRGI